MFKGRRAYDWSVEVSIYLQQGERGRGIGRMLYEELERRCKDQGICNLYACIAYTECGDEYLTNASVKFHEKLGFAMSVPTSSIAGTTCAGWRSASAR